MTRAALSVLDFCTVYEGETYGQAMARSVELAQHAEKFGFKRMWYTEHHNMPTITSSSPAVLIAHIAANTQSIRLGSGGVMLPNHSPYVVAEQFGTLAELHPNRIDLGLGRAPGTDMQTLGRALRRDSHSAERFPEDIKELNGYLTGKSIIPGVRAIPGENTSIPIYILGSSMYGASLAAKLGLPYAFASHFAPQHLQTATKYYKDNYEPSEQYPEPYLIAAVNVLAADSDEAAQEEWEKVCFNRVKAFAGRGKYLTDQQVEQIVASYQGQQILEMLKYSAVGTKEEVRDYLEQFQQSVGADELMISLQSTTHDSVLHNMELLAEAWDLT
ncbi:alkane 1-monooxygenase [Corynebacterium sp. HMSC077D10]|uniref:LLM class flavin-dependent oxidoreductase n=1 Tax=unclassified Corynebacterium TaxID=2624378 RepID=UPI0008A60A7C|nr:MULTISPECIES: LLM class flavin-dependent oxidoreductase [unclassified Corynebacterium]OFL78966.1 alkane 1-monooxygenase [Corynebacterium sp. HMSC077B05]OFP16965.1 alkane 1-monooxygenase [Corynebacterium sp. HMSC065A05]OFP67530.1 alkane 1-monooxygenase [Corynebacterium sp. HMSC077D10]